MPHVGLKGPIQVLPGDGEACYWGPVFSVEESRVALARLLEEVPWKRETVVLFGREHVLARKVSWHGEAGCDYAYAGRRKAALPWTECLKEVKARVEDLSGVRFNSCLLNLYHSGAEGMGWHSDDEPELGAQPVIASVSLGAERRFLFRHRVDGSTVEVKLENGSLLVMRGTCQQHWKHCLPKALRIHEQRINLTFRKVGG
jgi:alkylated DNA repair dioxygenase AlkB